MARVLGASAAENSPAAPLSVHRFSYAQEFPARDAAKKTWHDNARKAYHHAAIINNASDGEVLGMLDADTMVLRDLSEMESMHEDIAITYRPPGSRWLMNSGVYFVRISERTKRFASEWFSATCAMLQDAELHDLYREKKRFGGTHQAAFGWMLENRASDLRVMVGERQCAEWNCVNGCYETAENPRIVHLMKHSMRRWCLEDRPAPNANAQRLADKWKQYDAQCATKQ